MFREAMNSPIHIEEVREIGQNYQLFIPVIFKYPVRFIHDMLAYCVVHPDSHSHSRKTFEQKLHIQDVITETLSSIARRLKVDENERTWFKAKIAEYDCKNRLDILQHYQETKHLGDIVQKMKQLGCYDSAARKMVMKIRYPFIKRLADFIWSKKNK